jgi:hypothetical protein
VAQVRAGGSWVSYLVSTFGLLVRAAGSRARMAATVAVRSLVSAAEPRAGVILASTKSRSGSKSGRLVFK